MKNRFNFSKAEKVGVAVLSLIIVILLVVINTPKHTLVPDVFIVDSSVVKYIDVSENKPFKTKEKKRSKTQSFNYSNFDPNEYTESDWQSIGFTDKQSRVIVKYKNQINGFKKDTDLAECFVISEKKFKDIKPYLRIKKQEVYHDEKNDIATKFDIVELNTTDQTLLETVKGIGPYFGMKIIEYRQKLGGYYQVEQLLEIYGMTQENYDQILNQVKLDTSKIKQIHIATVKFDELKRHPYVNWKQSQVIMSLSNKTVTSEFWKTLKSSEAFSKKDIKRLKPYFK